MENPSPDLRRTTWKAICLALIAGFVDGYALRILSSYVSFMSGNTTLAGMNLGEGLFAAATPPLVAVSAFFAGSFTGSLLMHSMRRHARCSILLISALLIVAFMGLNYARHPVNVLLGVALLSPAMGLLNPAVAKVGAEPLSLTFVTGTLNKVAGHLALALKGEKPENVQGSWDSRLYRALLETGLWVSFLSGAILSGAAARLERMELALPVLALAILSAVSCGTIDDGPGPWQGASRN